MLQVSLRNSFICISDRHLGEYRDQWKTLLVVLKLFWKCNQWRGLRENQHRAMNPLCLWNGKQEEKETSPWWNCSTTSLFQETLAEAQRWPYNPRSWKEKVVIFDKLPKNRWHRGRDYVIHIAAFLVMPMTDIPNKPQSPLFHYPCLAKQFQHSMVDILLITWYQHAKSNLCFPRINQEYPKLLLLKSR